MKDEAERVENVGGEKQDVMAQAKRLDEAAELLRKEGAKNKDMMKRQVLFGVAAGLETAACALRDHVLDLPETDAAQLLARYRATRIDYLLEAAPGSLPHKRPPKLMVSRVLSGLGKERNEGKSKKRK